MPRQRPDSPASPAPAEAPASPAGTITLYRMGDFYEAFDDDAGIVALELGIVLTRRDGRPMAGFPVYGAARYFEQLVAAGCFVEFA